jgi:YaiO family outer membrane protein
MRWCSRLLAACSLAVAAAGSAAQPAWQVEVGSSVEQLSNDSPDWRQSEIAVRRRDEGRMGELSARDVERYGRRDTELAASVAWPMAPAWSIALRANVAPGADFLPRLGGGAELTRRLGDGWVAGAGLGRNRYDGADTAPTGTTTLRLGLERYVGAWRLAGGVARARLDGGAAESGWRAQVDHFFGDEARVGVVFSGGRELESAPDGVVSTRVDSVVLMARWPLAAGWLLGGELSRTRVSDIERQRDGVSESLPGGYRRTGVRLGVQRAF